MYYYGNTGYYGGYNNPNPYGGGAYGGCGNYGVPSCGCGFGAAIWIVLFILLVIIIGAGWNWNNNN